MSDLLAQFLHMTTLQYWIVAAMLAVGMPVLAWRFARRKWHILYDGSRYEYRDAPHADDILAGVVGAIFWPMAIPLLSFIIICALLVRAVTNFGYDKEGKP